jgi:hypothetical protein
VPSVTETPGDGRELRAACPEGGHDLHVVGYVHRSESTRLDCAQPLRAVCRRCSFQAFWRCDCSSAAKCPDCAERRRRLVARLVHLGTTDRLGSGYTYFVTLSAPGENEHRKWVQVGGAGVPSLPRNRPACECHREWETSHRGEWNAQESSHWNRLRTALARSVDSFTYIGSVEVQERGMLHRHLVINVDRPLIASEIGDAALAAGYGCVHDVQVIASAEKAAWYISKYVTKSAGDREGVPWRKDVVDKETGEIRVLETVPTFRTWSSAQSWGYTLKGLREIARLQARARAKYLAEFAQMVAEDAHATGPPALTDSPSMSPP